MLFANVLSQQLPALFAPELLEAIVLALLRTLLIGGLISLGAAWQRSDPFRWVMMNANLRFFLAKNAAFFSARQTNLPLAPSRNLTDVIPWTRAGSLLENVQTWAPQRLLFSILRPYSVSCVCVS